MSNARMPTIQGQDWLIESMKLFDYPSNKGGVCFGIDAKAIPAILLSEVENFDTHCKHTHRIQLSHPTKAQIQHKIKSIQEKSEIEKSHIEKEVEEVQPFLQGIEIAQKAHQHYRHLLDKNHVQLQDIQQIAHLTLPNSLLGIGIYNNKEHNFMGAYTVEDFEDYFTSFQLAVEITYPPLANPVAFLLRNINHAITVGYDPKNQEWILIDANQLPSQRVTNTHEIAKKVIAAFSINRIGLIYTNVFCINHHKDINTLNRLMDNWKNTPDFMNLHDFYKGNKIFLHDSSNMNLLDLAAYFGSAPLVKTLLKITPPDHLIKKNSKVILYGIANNNIEIVKALLSAGFNIESVNKYGSTPLLTAITYGHYDMVEFLLDSGANIHVINKNKNTALSCALKHNHTKIFQLLISRGAVLDTNSAPHVSKPKKSTIPDMAEKCIVEEISNKDINAINSDGHTLLMIASKNGDDEQVLELLKLGAKIHHANQCTKTELMLAAQYGQYYVISVLLENCEIDINEVSINHESAISLAAHNGHYYVVNQLLDKGAKLNKQIITKILDNPKSNNFVQMFELLLKRNLIDADMRAKYFDIYLRYGYALLVRTLIEYDETIIPENAIRLALDLGHQATARVLLEKKICDYIQERSALEKHKPILTFFQAMGYDPNEKHSKEKKIEAAQVLLAVIRNAMRPQLLDKYIDPLEDGSLENIYRLCLLALKKNNLKSNKGHSLS